MKRIALLAAVLACAAQPALGAISGDRLSNAVKVGDGATSTKTIEFDTGDTTGNGKITAADDAIWTFSTATLSFVNPKSTSVQSALRLLEASGNGSNYVALRAPATLAGNYTLTLPDVDGTADQLIGQNLGATALEWKGVTASTAGRLYAPDSVHIGLADAGDTYGLEIYGDNSTSGIEQRSNDRADFVVKRSAGTVASPSNLSAAGDDLWSILWYGYHTSYAEAAEILVELDGTPGSGDMPGRIVFKTTADGSGSPTERVRITNAGNIAVSPTSFSLLQNTADASDDGSVSLSAGGSVAGSRGANMSLYGNEVSSVGGRFQLVGGDAATSSGSSTFLNVFASASTGAAATNVLNMTGAGALTVGPSTGGSLTHTFQSGSTGSTTLLVKSTATNQNAQVDISSNWTGPTAQLWSIGTNIASTDGRLEFRNATAGTNVFNILSTGAVTNTSSTGVVSTMHSTHSSPASTNILLLQDDDSAADANNFIIDAYFAGDNDVTNARFASFRDSGGVIGNIIGASGTTVAYNTSSDRRLKKDIEDYPGGLATVLNMRPRKFRWRENNKDDRGFIAQELRKVYPWAVSGSPDGDVKTAPMQVDYSKLTPVLAQAIKDLAAENAALRARLDSVESRLAAAGL